MLRQKAEESAAAILRQAESQAAAFLRQAASDAATRVAAADAQAVEILADAHGRRDRILGELEGQAATLRQRIKVLEKHHGRRVDAYDVVERSLVEARAVLAPPRAVGAPAVAPVQAADGARPPARSGPSRSEADTSRFRVYDWSPASEAG